MFSRCLQRSRDASKAGVGVHRLRSRLLVEPLEDRLVLSVFNVNSTADLLDPPDGVVTLRSALEMANQTPGNNTINLTVPGTYHITTPGSGQNDNTSGEFAIVPNGASPTGSTLTIENTSGGQVIVDGNHMDRVFDINPNDVVTAAPFTVLMQGFTIQNGVAQPGDAAEGSGGGIRDQGNVNLTLTNMTLTDNNATTDGGGLASGGPVTILNSTFLNNTAMGNGGGLAVGGTLTSVSNTEIDGNVSGGTGGAVFANGVTLTIQSSTLATNTSRDGGGGVELETSGAGLIQGSTISNTTITGNTVLNHPGADGGGIDASTAFTGGLLLLNDIISANYANIGGGVFWAATLGSTLTLQNTIIAGDSALVRPNFAPDAVPLWFTSMLDGTQQMVSNASPAMGNATVLLSPGQTTFRFGITFAILESPPPATVISGTIDHTNSGYGEQEVSNNGTVNPAPVITPSTTSLKLGTTTAGAAGWVQSYTVSGSNLTADLTIIAPTGVELSSDNGHTFYPSLTLTPTNGTLATTTIKARISASAEVGTIRGNIRYTSPGASEQEVSVSGTVNPGPVITPTATLLKLGTTTAGTAGSAQSTVMTDAGSANTALANLPQDAGTGARHAALPAIITAVFLAIAPGLPVSSSVRQRVRLSPSRTPTTLPY